MQPVLTVAIQDALTELGFGEVDFVIEHPKDIANGDYASNAAMMALRSLAAAYNEAHPDSDRIARTDMIARKNKATGEMYRSPRELAEHIAERLAGQIEYVDRIEVAGPGFLNFYLSRDFFVEELLRSRALGDEWGKNDTWAGKTVLFEYTSPNLFKPLHIGNLVGNIVGESLSRLFALQGATVKRFNYPSDIGLTVAKGVWGLMHTGADPSDIQALGEAYRVGNEAYEAGGAEMEEIKAINKALYAGDDEKLNALRDAGLATSKARLADLMTQLGTHFDHVIFESEASAPGTTIVREHVGDVFTESDGAVVYAGEKVGLHTRVFLNSAGLPTYEAKDIGHFTLKNKLEPEWDTSVIVTGNEQTEYFKVLFAALKELFPELTNRTLEHIPTGFLTLTTGKMSSRKGNVLTGESLLEDMQAAAQEKAAEARTDDMAALTEMVAVAALKYQILKQSVGSNIVFDKEKALSFEGDSGPYLQYTHARICSLLEKAAEVGVVALPHPAPVEPYALEHVLYQFPEVIEVALAERAPHKVVGYLTELAGAFNTFYAQEKIADASDEYAPYKAALAAAVQQTLKNGLWALGIKAPDTM